VTSLIGSKRPQNNEDGLDRSLAGCFDIISYLVSQAFIGSKGLDNILLSQLLIIISCSDRQGKGPTLRMRSSLKVLTSLVTCIGNIDEKLTAYILEYINRLSHPKLLTYRDIREQCANLLQTFFTNWPETGNADQLLIPFYRNLVSLLEQNKAGVMEDSQDDLVLGLLHECLYYMDCKHAALLNQLGPITIAIIGRLLRQLDVKTSTLPTIVEALSRSENSDKLAYIFAQRYLYPNFISWIDQLSSIRPTTDLVQHCLRFLLASCLNILPKDNAKRIQISSLLLPVFCKLLCQTDEASIKLAGSSIIPMITMHPAVFKDFLNNNCDDQNRSIIEKRIREAISSSSHGGSETSRAATPNSIGPKVVLKMKF